MLFNSLKIGLNRTEKMKWIYMSKITHQFLKLHLGSLNIFPGFKWLFKYFLHLLWCSIVLCLENLALYPNQLINHFHFLWRYSYYQNEICSWHKVWKDEDWSNLKSNLYYSEFLCSFPSICTVYFYICYHIVSIKFYILILNLSIWLQNEHLITV